MKGEVRLSFLFKLSLFIPKVTSVLHLTEHISLLFITKFHSCEFKFHSLSFNVVALCFWLTVYVTIFFVPIKTLLHIFLWDLMLLVPCTVVLILSAASTNQVEGTTIMEIIRKCRVEALRMQIERDIFRKRFTWVSRNKTASLCFTSP